MSLPSPSDAQPVIVALDSAFTDDAHINRDNPNNSLGDNNNFRVGFNNDDLKRGVFRFETSLVPNPGTVTSVLLVLKINDNYLDDAPMDLHAYSLAERFIEGTGTNGYDVSWNDRMNGIPWSVPGGSWDPGKLSRTTVETWHDSLVLDITTQFQAWVADTSKNHGLILGDSLYFAQPAWNYDDHGIRITASSSGTTSEHPYLIVSYAPVIKPATGDSSCVVLQSTFTRDSYIEGTDVTHSHPDRDYVTMGFQNDTNRGVLRFGLDRFTKLKDIAAVELRWPLKDNNLASTQLYDAYPLLEEFQEGGAVAGFDISWIHRDSGIPWTNPGGTFDSSMVSRFNVTPADTALSIDITNIFEAWAADTSTNFGLVLGQATGFIDPTTGNGQYVEAWSTEESDTTLHPKVIVYYDSLSFTTSVIDSVVGEIEPYTLIKSTLDTLTLSIDLDFGFGDDGVDIFYIDMPAGFTLDEVVAVRRWGSPFGQYNDASGPNAVVLNTWFELSFDGRLEIDMAVNTPTTPSLGGIWFHPRVGNTSRSTWQIVPEGEANGTPGDWDQLRVDVADVKASVTITPASASVTTDSIIDFDAIFSDTTVSHTATWNVAGGIGTIDSAGVFNPNTVGSGRVIVSEGALADTATVTVGYGSWVDLLLSPSDTLVVADEDALFLAGVMDADSNFFYPDPEDVTWSEPRGLGTVDDGEFATTTAGTTYVWAAYGGQTDSSRVIVVADALDSILVTPSPDTVSADSTRQYYASGYDEHGNPVAINPVWNVQGGIGWVTFGGLFTPTNVGTGTVRAAVGPIKGNATVTVTAGAARTVVITPDSLTAFPGDTVYYTAQAFDTIGTALDSSLGSWWAPNGLATSLGGGAFEADATGFEYIVFAMNARSDTASLSILAATLDSIVITPDSSSLSADSSITFTATGYYSDASSGAVSALWRTEGGIGTIDSTGLFDATKTGSGIVIAETAGLFDTADVFVTVGALARVNLSPSYQSASVGDTVTYIARGFDADNNEITPMTGGSWWSNHGFSTYFGAGSFVCTATGVDTVAAFFSGVGDSATLDITSALLDSIVIVPSPVLTTTDSSIAFGATGYYNDASTSPVSPTWSVVGGIGTIQTDGTFDPTTVGSGLVIAVRGAHTDTADVTVTRGAVASIQIVPAIDTIVVTDSIAFSATAMDADSNVFTPPFTWSEPTALGSIDTTGVFVSASVGLGEVRAEAESIMAFAAVSIVPGPLVSIVIAPAPDTLSSDTTLVFTATGYDALGFPIALTPSWTVLGGIGSIDAGGSFTGGTAGFGAVVADTGAIADTVWFAVVPGTAVSLDVLPDSTGAAAGDTVSFTASVTDAQGNTVDTTVSWATDVGVIDGSGNYVGTTAGLARPSASLGSIADSSAVFVTPGTPVVFTITPHDTTVTADDVFSFLLAGADAFGNPVSLDSVSWGGGVSIGTISPVSGFFDATTVGTDTVTATWNDTTIASGPIAVTPGVVATIAVTPDTMLTGVGSDSTFTATLRDADGNETSGAVAWTSTGIAGSIDSSGLFHADTVGTTGIVATVGSLADTATAIVFDGSGLRITAVLEDRATVIQGETGIPVRVAMTNESGDRINGITVSMYFHIAGRGVTGQYLTSEAPSKDHTLANGESDTLTFFVDVLGTAETDEVVTIGASAVGELEATGLPVADLAPDVTGDWIVLSGLQLDDVARSFFPGKMRPGQSAGFVIQLRNEGTEDLILRTGTRLVIDNGVTTVEADLLEAVSLPAGGSGSTARFEIRTIPTDWTAGSYALTFLVDGENEAGLPLATTYTAKKNALQIAPPYVFVSTEGIEGAIHPPGAEDVILAHLEIVNLYETNRTLASVTARNATDGTGTQSERDSVLTAVRLVHDRNRDGLVDASDTTIATGRFTGGSLTFANTDLMLAPEDTLSLLTTADVSLMHVPDGTQVDAWFTGDTLSFDCGPGTIVFGADTLFSPGDHFVDGMIAAQIGTSAPFSPNIAGGAADSLALVLDLPSNGYESDTLRSLAIRNFGTAEVDLDISRVSIWRDGGDGVYDRGAGDDTRLGYAAWIGEGYWSLSERVFVPPGGVRLFATVDITEFARESQTIRLGIPVDGADMTSRNDGPIDVEARLANGRTIGSANRILFSQTDEPGDRTVPPGYETSLLRFTLSNLYADTVSIRGLAVVDESTSPADSAFSIVRLYREGAAGGRESLTETNIAGGLGLLDGFSLTLPPGKICTLSVEGTIATTCVSDGDVLSMRIASAQSFQTGLSRFVTGIFPAATLAPVVVDGFSTMQIAADVLGDGPIAPGGAEQLLLRAQIPSNGCGADRMNAIEIVNAGSADYTAFSSLRLVANGANVGDLVWDGLAWVRDGFDVPVPAGGVPIEIHGAIALGAPEGGTVRVRLALDGIEMDSDNDGPIDAPFDAPDEFTITDAPLFTRFMTPPRRVSAGQTFDVTLFAINISTEMDTLIEVEPNLFTITGPASVTVPNTETIDELAPGDTALFVWTVRADSAGTVTFSGNATADGSNGSETSLASTSPPVLVQDPATGTVVSVVSAIPTSVTRGLRDLRAFVLDCSHADDAGTGRSDIAIHDLQFRVTDEDGVTLDPSLVISRATVQRTGATIGTSELAKNTDSTLTITFTDTVRVLPGGGTSLVLLFDISDSASVARFRIGFESDHAVQAHDANSHESVPLSGNLPYLSEVVGLFNAPSGLEVAAANRLPEAVNRGSNDVAIGELTLSSTGIPEETASILADNLCLVVTDTTFPYASLSVWAGDVRHFAESGWSMQGDTLYLPLIPALGIPANNPIRVTLRGDVRTDAVLGASSIDSAFVLIRSAASDSLPLLVTAHEPFTTTIQERIAEIAGRSRNRVPIDPVFQGARAVPIVDVVFEPVPKENGASATLHAITIALTDTNGAATAMADLTELVILTQDGARIGAASAAGLSGNALRVPLDVPLPVRPGSTRNIALSIDLKADAPRADYRFTIPVAAIELTDANAGTPVSFVTTVDTIKTSGLAVREVTSRVDLYFDASLPATSVGGGAVESGATVGILASGEQGDVTLHLASFTIALEDENGSVIAPADIIANATARTSNGNEVVMTLASDRLVAHFASDGEPITPGDTLTLSVDWTVVDNPNVASYRVRIVEDAVVLEENVALLARAFDDPGTNPSGLTYFVDKQFETSLRNYPNPFAVSGGTTIAFYCHGGGRVSIDIFTGLGVPVKTITRTISEPGLVEVFWQGENGDGKNVISGVYLASIVVTYNDGKRDHAIHKIAVLN